MANFIFCAVTASLCKRIIQVVLGQCQAVEILSKEKKNALSNRFVFKGNQKHVNYS